MSKTHPIIQAVMDEHIQLPGCPQLIVTRGWAYRWLRDELGYDPTARGFASLDYMVFGRKETKEPLTDLTLPHIAHLIAYMVRVETGQEAV